MSDYKFETLDSESTKTLESIPNPQPPNQDPSIVPDQTSETSDQSKKSDQNTSDQSKVDPETSEEVIEEEEEEEGECGFCLFMKGGGCKDSFVAWEKCIEEAEKNNEDIVDKCFEVTGMLKKCMEAHPDYYDPILQAEKEAEKEVVRELEKEKTLKESDQQQIGKVSNDSGKDLGSGDAEQIVDSSDKNDS